MKALASSLASPLLLAAALLAPGTSAAEPITRGVRPDLALQVLAPDGRSRLDLFAELADRPDTMQRGLMFRDLDRSDEGMLFAYPDAGPRSFWMRNTPTSLDIIFVDAEQRILNIAAHTRPYSDESYNSRGAAQYVLEIRAGLTEQRGIQPGDRLRWHPLGPEARIGFDLAALDADGMIGAGDGKRVVDYELCLPRDEPRQRLALALDPSLRLQGDSPGRIGCGAGERLAIGSTAGRDHRARLLGLASLDYVRRIEPAYFE